MITYPIRNLMRAVPQQCHSTVLNRLFSKVMTVKMFTYNRYEQRRVCFHSTVCGYLFNRLRFICQLMIGENMRDRKSTRLNSSHVSISYAVFCFKKKNKCICRRCTLL